MSRDNPTTGITAFVALEIPIASRWASWCKHSGKVRLEIGNRRWHGQCAHTHPFVERQCPVVRDREFTSSVHHLFNSSTPSSTTPSIRCTLMNRAPSIFTKGTVWYCLHPLATLSTIAAQKSATLASFEIGITASLGATSTTAGRLRMQLSVFQS